MSLRLVNDGERADGTLYCRWNCRASSRPNPATMLMDVNWKGPLPACDDCARLYYELRPDLTTFAPLDGYVDMFAAAKEAALATPEQVTGQTCPTPDRVERSRAVEQHIARDQVIYCYGRPCLLSGQFTTPADVLVRVSGADFGGHPWTSLCNACLDSRQAGGWYPEETRPADDEDAKSAILLGANGSWSWPAPHKPVTLRARLITGASVLAGFVGGVVMCSIANTTTSDFWTAENDGKLPISANPPSVGALEGWGMFLIVVSVLAGLIWLIAEIVKQSTPKPVPARRAASRQQGYAPQQGHAGPWYTNPDVITAAAMGGAAVAAHEAAKLHRGHVAERRAAGGQRQAAIRAHSQQLSNENLQRQNNATTGLGYKINEQIGYGAMITPHHSPRSTRASHMPNSDIYGNTWYRS